MKASRAIVLAAAMLGAAAAMAGEEKVKLEPGPGFDKVRQNCVACHSLDYIQMNSPFLDRKGWEATVAKMNKAYGAPIPPEDAPAIAEYLAKHYGKR
ncbi:MAG: cytochrome c [Betaproteobacteria bacterium]